MQKFSLFPILKEEFLRALVFALSFFFLMILGFVSLAHASDEGGYFGILLNKILVAPWDDTSNDGTVKNALKLGGNPATDYVPLGTNLSCAVNQCVYGFDSNGDVLCR